MKRYPGIRSFTSADSHLYKGREKESRELFQLIVLNNIVVLFGKSGVGKTSLLQASVCPELENRNLHPVFIRLNQTQLKPEEQIYQQLKDKEYIPKDTPAGLSLWEYLNKFYYVDLGEVFQPVIIFDQFEELFTLYSPKERVKFILEFADVINRRIPTALKGKPNSDDQLSPPEVKFVISLRSDFLYLLDELSRDIPAILRTRLQLHMLNRSNADAAITLPAAQAGSYDSPVFSYSDSAVSNIVDTLSKEESDQLSSGYRGDEPEIEAFQLQLFCGHIEDRIIEEKKEIGFEVTTDYYGGAEGIQQIIQQFYLKVLSKVGSENEEAVERLLATGLLRNKRRIIMEESSIKEEFKISKSVLDTLHKERLVSREARKGSLYYELVHDTLVEPVLKKYKNLVKKDEEKRIEKERQVQEEQLAEERRKRRKTMWLAIIGFTLAAISVVALFMVWQQSKNLKTANSKIVIQAYENAISLATAKKIERKYSEAIGSLEDAMKWAEQLGEEETNKLRGLKQQWNKVAFFVHQGDSIARLEQYNLAIEKYSQANKLSPDSGLQQLVDEAELDRKRLFDILQSDAERFERAEVYKQAVATLERALKLEPGNINLKKKIEALKKKQ